MSTLEDARWKQRFHTYKRVLAQLTSAVGLSRERPLSDLEKQGLIQAFEYCHELAWGVLKDYFAYQGNAPIMGSRDATREAFNRGLITDGEGWMKMIISRNQTSHTYNADVADSIAGSIVSRYHPLFLDLQRRMQELYDAD